MTFRRGEVYSVDFGAGFGHEQGGRRPAVVVSGDWINRLPMVVTVVPNTSRLRSATLLGSAVALVPAGEAGLTQDTLFLAFQIRAIDHRRFQPNPLGVLTPNALARIEKAMCWTLEI